MEEKKNIPRNCMHCEYNIIIGHEIACGYKGEAKRIPNPFIKPEYCIYRHIEKIEDERDRKAVEAGREAIIKGDHIIFGKDTD